MKNNKGKREASFDSDTVIGALRLIQVGQLVSAEVLA